jgi:hypothetical protein
MPHKIKLVVAEYDKDEKVFKSGFVTSLPPVQDN